MTQNSSQKPQTGHPREPESSEASSLDEMTAPVVRRMRQLVGSTPLVCVKTDGFPHSGETGDAPDPVYFKMEQANPTGSIRDRYLGEILGRAVAAGTLVDGDTVAVAGIDDSAVAAAFLTGQFDLNLRIFAPTSESRRLLPLVEKFGADIEWLDDTDYAEAIDAAVDWTRDASERMFIDGYRPRAVTDAYADIADEIRDGLDELEPGAFVTSVTTGGAYRQVTGELRTSHPELVVGGAVLSDREFPGLPDDDEHVLRSVSLDRAWEVRDWLAAERGLLVGPKGAAAFSLACELQHRLDSSKTAVALNPDAGQRYLGWEGTDLFSTPRGQTGSID